MKIAFPVVQALFVIVQVGENYKECFRLFVLVFLDHLNILSSIFQTYVLWVHAKDCVQIQQIVTR